MRVNETEVCLYIGVFALIVMNITKIMMANSFIQADSIVKIQ